jgi:hypothetical protein
MRRDEQCAKRARSRDHWVYLDRWWAQRLGVKRTAGVYRIRSRELARRLSQESLGVDASGTVFAYGRTPTTTSINERKQLKSEWETVTRQRRY